LHRRLIFGEKPIKRHVIPWDAVDRLALVEHHPGLYVFSPAAELTLLLARILLRSVRLSHRSGLRQWSRSAIEPGMLAELQALSPLVKDDELDGAAHLLLPPLESPMRRIRECFATDAPDARAVVREAKHLSRSLHPVATRPRRTTAVQGLRLQRTNVIRRLNSGGLVIGLIGADGAGKSTLAGLVHGVFAGKLSSTVA
jgi:ABC-type multidrug transport system fused ATPase/permease subunit